MKAPKRPDISTVIERALHSVNQIIEAKNVEAREEIEKLERGLKKVRAAISAALSLIDSENLLLKLEDDEEFFQRLRKIEALRPFVTKEVEFLLDLYKSRIGAAAKISKVLGTGGLSRGDRISTAREAVRDVQPKIILQVADNGSFVYSKEACMALGVSYNNAGEALDKLVAHNVLIKQGEGEPYSFVAGDGFERALEKIRKKQAAAVKTSRVVDPGEPKSPQVRERLVEMLKAGERINGQLCMELGRSSWAVRRELKALVEAGIAERTGGKSGPGVKYALKKEPEVAVK